MKKSIASKVIALALVVMGVCNIVAPIISYAALSNQLGTQAALGSPLLNQNFSTDDFQKYEPLAFGVFISNFCIPLVDDYKSAFATGQGGSEGRGREALQFAGGNDSEANKALQSLLDYSINAQKPMKEISVQYEVYERADAQLGIGTTTMAPATPRRANAADLLIEYDQTSSSASGAKCGDDTNPVTPWFSADNTDNVSGRMGDCGNTRLALVHKYRMPIFTVKGNDGTTDIVVFDMTDSWDLQVYAMWMGNVAYGVEDYKEEANNNMDKMVPNGEPSQATPLYLDTYGNIVTLIDGRCVIMLPAAANQHLTKSRKINLINSVILNGRYTNQGLTSLMENATSAGFSGWDQMNDSRSVSGDGININGASKGEVYLSFDTDSTIYRQYDECKANGMGANDFHAEHGKALVELAEAKMGFSGNKIGLKVNISGLASNSTQNWWLAGWHSADGYDTLVKNAATAAQQLGSMAQAYPAEIIDYIHTNVSEKDPIFGDHGYIVVSEAGGRKNMLGDLVVNGALKYLDGSDVQIAAGVHGMPSQTRMKSTLTSGEINGGKTSAFKAAMYLMGGTDTQLGATTIGEEKFGPIAQNSLLRQSALKMNSGMDTANALGGTRIVDVADDVFSTKGNKVEALGGDWWHGLNVLSSLVDLPGAVDGLMNGATRIENMTQRVQKVYIPNQNMKSAENIMGIREGTQFAAWTPWIYITYLEAYNVKKDTSDFDTRIFAPGMDILNVDPTELLDDVYMSDEEKQKSVNDYTFLMLHPTKGREYREGLLIDWINDLIYNSYISMVYGQNVYNHAGGIGSTSSAGFLHFNSYEDNLLTGWFIQSYIENTVMILGLGAIAVVVVGIIMRKRFSWMILSLIMLVNIVLLVPSIGDLTPTIASECIQKIFTSKANFWALEESIANQAIEERYIAETGGSSSDASAVHTYMKMMNTVNLDRTLMLKQDISKKVVENATGIMNVVQENASTRWLLPRLMSQFNADDGSKDFVHVTLGDTFDNWSNLYWVYEPNDRVNAGTINASSTGSASVTKMDLSTRQGLWQKFADTSGGSLYDNNPDMFSVYQSSYTPDGGKETWKSNSRAFNETDNTTIPAHTVSYIIPDLHVPARLKDQTWEEFAKAYDLNDGGSAVTSDLYEEWVNTLLRIEGNASAYNPREIGALPDFGYLWMTENPGTYFYEVVKETYAKDNVSFAELAGNIQGNYINSSYTGGEARVSSMHFSNTGKVKDILDLEELFTNVIPYMHNVQTVACGTDGTNGIFGDMKLEDYHIYEDNNASWLFRSNWVTKIVENKYYTKPVTVHVPGFGDYTIADPTDPRCYPELVGRPMIFSEAQQDAYGIADSDLTLVELKCIAVNKSVERRWSLLLNYVNTSGMTLEVMCRQMALEALLEFNKEFSDAGVSNSTLMMYPTSIDLRYLSFDSIMKMLVLNSSGNASYIYGDTMKGVIENSDFFSILCLLFGAFLCQVVVPLARDVIMGLVLYLGIWSVLCNIFAGGRAKLKVCAGYIISNGAYLVMTIAYYAVFGILIKMNTADEVLSINNITVDNGPPIFSFLIIIVASWLYIYGTFKMVKFVLRNFKDLGFEVYAAWGSMIAGKIGDGISGLKNSLEGMRGDGASAGAQTGSLSAGAGVAVAGAAAAGAVAGTAGAAVLIQQAEDAKTGEEEDTSGSGYTVTESGYTMTEEVKAGEGQDVDFDIEQAIHRGHRSDWEQPLMTGESVLVDEEPATAMDEQAKPEDSDAE